MTPALPEGAGPVRDVASLGPRWSVRRRLGDGTVGDVVGHVVERSPAAVTLLPENGPEVRLVDSDVLAARAIPERVVRPTSSVSDVARLAARCWPGVERARLGGWVLRAGNGFTRRANSALLTGDPGHPPDEALALVAAWYAERDLPLLVIDPSTSGTPAHLPGEWDTELVTDLLVADVRRMDRDHALPDDARVHVTEEPSPGWCDLWRDGAAHAPAARAVLTGGPARYVTLEDDSGPVGCARTTLTGRWAYVACVTVRADRRGRGLGRALMHAVLDDARQADPRTAFALVEVEADNSVARALYTRLGFRRHHTWRYRTPRPGAFAGDGASSRSSSAADPRGSRGEDLVDPHGHPHPVVSTDPVTALPAEPPTDTTGDRAREAPVALPGTATADRGHGS